jgi:hypothetical protein
LRSDGVATQKLLRAMRTSRLLERWLSVVMLAFAHGGHLYSSPAWRVRRAQYVRGLSDRIACA